MSDSPQISNFKERYTNHQTSFRHPSKRNETELSTYIWDLKDLKKSFRVKWRILRSWQPYSNVSKKCNLCLQEKYFIIFRKDLSSLSKRYELASSCRHRDRFTLKFFRKHNAHVMKRRALTTGTRKHLYLYYIASIVS